MTGSNQIIYLLMIVCIQAFLTFLPLFLSLYLTLLLIPFPSAAFLRDPCPLFLPRGQQKVTFLTSVSVSE